MLKLYNYRCMTCGADIEEVVEDGTQPKYIQCHCARGVAEEFNYAQSARAWVNDERQGGPE